jgi:hypothetical protein
VLKLNVKKWFYEAVALDTTYPKELKDTLKTSGHKNLEGFFDNMVFQLEEAEKKCLKQGTPLKLDTMREAVYSMAPIFMQGMTGESIQRYEADIQKSIREHEADKIKEFESVLSGNAEGEFAEAGVITNEEIDQQREVGFN